MTDEWCKVCEVVKPNDDGSYQCMVCRRKFVAYTPFSAELLEMAGRPKINFDDINNAFDILLKEIHNVRIQQGHDHGAPG